jgi:hypothetical protein
MYCPAAVLNRLESISILSVQSVALLLVFWKAFSCKAV